MRQREVAAMTDARLPEPWLSDRRLSRLSDAHYRSYIQALLFSVSNRTDGVIEPDDQPAVMQPRVTQRDETEDSPLSIDVMTNADR